MNHGSQTIQQQGRIIKVGSQEGGGTGEHGEGKGWKVVKNQVKHPGEFKPRSQTCTLAISKNRRVMSKRWKKYSGELIQEIRHYRNKLAIYRDSITSCIHCKADFQKRHGEANKYCSAKCHDEFRVMLWLPCSICMASAGISSNIAGKLLGMAGANIRRHWKRRGIKRDESAGIQAGRIRAQIERAESKREITNQQAQKAYESACLNEIKMAAKDFDWGCIASYEIAKKKGREYQSRRHHSSPKNSNFRLKKIARCRIYNAIKRLGNVEKPRIRYRTEKMVGCTIEQLKAHLEAQFKRGMTWDNHGSLWHIDHIIPMAHFDVTDENQLLAASHYTNMQPMWAHENLAKSDKLQKDTQMELRICATH
jgi:hypothetical protein